MKDLRPHRHYSLWDSIQSTWKEWPTWNRVVVVIVGFLLLSSLFSSPEEKKPLTPAQARKAQIETHFSAWNGAHEGLERLVKAQLVNPDSYKHVKTEYWDMDDYLIVNMTYQATNAFGATVRGFVKAKTSIDGKVLSVLESR